MALVPFLSQGKWKPKRRGLAGVSGIPLHCQAGSLLCSALGLPLGLVTLSKHYCTCCRLRRDAGSLLQSTDQFPLKQTLGVLLETGRMHWVWLLPPCAVLQLYPV